MKLDDNVDDGDIDMMRLAIINHFELKSNLFCDSFSSKFVRN